MFRLQLVPFCSEPESNQKRERRIAFLLIV